MEIDRRLRSRALAAASLALVLVVALMIDVVARDVYRSEVRSSISAEADGLIRELSDVIARETSGVEALAAFVELNSSSQDLSASFVPFAEALMRQGGSMRSLQLAPASVIQYVYPIEGNEAALGLDLMADPDRQALLLPAIETGRTVIQGPVELVQGGVGVLVRKPIYRGDGSFWGFSAVLLDWPSIVSSSRLGRPENRVLYGIRLPGTTEVIGGSAAAFGDDPVLRRIQVGATSTVWEVAVRPVDGWPTAAPVTGAVWSAGLIVAVLIALSVYSAVRRPEILRRERAAALADLALAEARYQVTFEHAGVGIVIADGRGRVISANQSFRNIMGFAPDDPMVGVTADDIVHPDDLGSFRADARALLDGAAGVGGEYRLRGPGGDRWGSARITRIAADPTETLYVGIIEDVTARRQAESALAESEIRFRQLFEHAPIAIQREDHAQAQRRLRELIGHGDVDIRRALAEDTGLLTELLGLVRIIDANPAANELQRHLDTDAGHRTLIDRLTASSRATFVETFAAMAEGQTDLDLAVQTVASDGSELYLDLRWHVPTLSGQPDHANVMVSISDATELRRTERRLQGLLESKDRFLASVAHELRTPLTAVVGFAQALIDPEPGYSPEELAEFAELVVFHGNEMSHLIDDLLVWARADIGEVAVSPRRLDLGQSIGHTLRTVVDDTWEVATPDGSVEAVADPLRLRQIVRNLLTNAIRYGGPNKRFVLRKTDDRAVIDVADDGPALSPDEMRRIFEPYERSSGTASQPGSIGLGLTVCRSLARLQGGDVAFVREAEENVFRVTLPLAAPSAEDVSRVA